MKRKKVLIVFLSLIVIVFIAFFLWKNSNKNEKIHKQTRFLMDTYCTIQAVGPVKATNRAISKALDRIEEIDDKFNVTKPVSPIFDFNKKNIPITDTEIISLVQIALDVSRESDGAFDITIFPLIKLWGFYSDSTAVPEDEKIAECLEKMGYDKLVIENNTLTKTDSRVEIELGGIAKGHAIVEAVKSLKESGIESALIDAGGDIYALGKLWGDYWKIGVQHPRSSGVIGVIEGEDNAIVTSGDYERFFEEDGVRYHHILDPETGYPSKGLASVTVISTNTILADAWSTTLFILGLDKGLDLVEKMQDLETMMITLEGEVFCSSGLKNKLETINKKE
ncbi:MAG: FAD:protein FMN transferase [Armatimonadetes bacterium]|nr:FAD:protein FMN transferase [Armatimonadota bacterium]